MTKKDAVRLIIAASEWRISHQLVNSEVMKEDLHHELEYNFSEEKVDYYQIIETDKGFYLGEFRNGMKNGYGAYLHYEKIQPNSLYLGYWQDNYKHGEGFSLMNTGACYHGEFVDSLFQGKQSHMIGRDGVEIVADFYKGDIKKVSYCNNESGFTYKGVKYDRNGNKKTSGSCSGWICLVLFVLLGLGLYSYCSAWWETQKPSSQIELYGTTTTYICTARQSLKVRTSPSTSASQIGSIMSGEEVEVYEISNGFAKIRFKGSIGYASTKYLKRK